jgi:hypothetical protein
MPRARTSARPECREIGDEIVLTVANGGVGLKDVYEAVADLRAWAYP